MGKYFNIKKYKEKAAKLITKKIKNGEYIPMRELESRVSEYIGGNRTE